ncbi:MAG: penicillin-binding protein 1A [Thermoanaerobacteraceae bacterium]|nr:penicillin-binding protein 1A [Thermoanaerobacteraceae bacterium]
MIVIPLPIAHGCIFHFWDKIVYIITRCCQRAKFYRRFKKVGNKSGSLKPGIIAIKGNPKRKRKSHVFIKIALLLLLLGLLTGCTAPFSWPSPTVPTPSRVLDAEGRLIATITPNQRIPVALKDISPEMQKAVVAIEDARFYRHHGIDPVGLARALYRNARAGKIVEGGSTITQQLAKNMYLGPEKTLTRKIKELWLTIQLERQYSKDEILQMYLNQVYFGQGAYGIEMAARTYFAKSARDLDLAESAMLAGLIRAPSLYNPVVDPDRARDRQAQVLQRMVELGMITPQQAKEARAKPLKPRNQVAGQTTAAYFVAEVVKYIQQKYPQQPDLVYSGGLTIRTTLDLDMQKAAEKALQDGLSAQNPDLEGALVALDPRTGYIKAMVGGRNFNRSQYNRALARSQPGSAFKPFLYAAALERGYTAATTLECKPASYPVPGQEPYRPTDFNGGYHNRPFTLKEALYTSDNVVAVELNNRLGPETLVACARRLGIDSPLHPYLSLPLGAEEVTPLEMARAYGALANRGQLSKPLYITQILDRRGNVLEENNPQLQPVLDEKIAYIVTDMLKGVLQPGGTAADTGKLLNRPAAGKTGTTTGLKDVWFVGYTPQLVCAVYVGYDDKQKSTGATSGQLAAPLWAGFMAAALQDQPAEDFPVPGGVTLVDICADDGLKATPFSRRVIRAAFVEGTEPVLPCFFGSNTPWGLKLRDLLQPGGETP